MSQAMELLLAILQRKTEMTLRDIAKMTGVDVSVLRKWRESPDPNPGLKELRKWQEVLHLPLDTMDRMLADPLKTVEASDACSDLRSYSLEWLETMNAFAEGRSIRVIRGARRAFQAAENDDQRGEALLLEAAGTDLNGDYERVIDLLEQALGLAETSPRVQLRLKANLASPYLYLGRLPTAIQAASAVITDMAAQQLPQFDQKLPWEPQARPYSRITLATAKYFRGMARLDMPTRATSVISAAEMDLADAARMHREIAADVPEYTWAAVYAESCEIRAMQARVELGTQSAHDVATELSQRMSEAVDPSSVKSHELEKYFWMADAVVNVSRKLKGPNAPRMFHAFAEKMWDIAEVAGNREWFRRYFVIEDQRRMLDGGIDYARKGMKWPIDEEQVEALLDVMTCVPNFVPTGLRILTSSFIEETDRQVA
jgi:hypothetical protein